MSDNAYMEITVVEGEPPKWMADLDERERDEVSHAVVYSELYHHGTTGHMALMLIAKLARKLNEAEGYGKLVSTGTEIRVEEPVEEPEDQPAPPADAPADIPAEPTDISIHVWHPLADRGEGEGHDAGC